MNLSADAAARETALNDLYANLVNLETTITEAEQRALRMQGATSSVDSDRFPSMKGLR